MSANSVHIEDSVRLKAEPRQGLVDDPVRITASGLNQNQSVTLISQLNNDGGVFVAHAQYVADSKGQLDLDISRSLGGSYTGVESMGLLWSMKPAPGQKYGLRLFKKDVHEPLLVELTLVNGHVTSDDTAIDQIPRDAKNQQILAKITLERLYQAPDVVEIPVKEGKIRGSLFVPPGEGPFPAVIDMFGTAGGLIKMRAALLASRGFISLALPFFGYEDLPEHMNLDMEYFEEAIDWFYSHVLVLRHRGIGVIGVSKGASLALHCATISKKIVAAVSVNGYCCHSFGQHRYHGNIQPVVNPAISEVFETEEGIVYGQAMTFKPQHQSAIIPIELASHAEILFIRGGDDPSCDPTHVDVLTARLRRAELNNYRVLDYPGAGHLIEPPYSPHCRVCYTKIIRKVVVYGGDSKSHATAQQESWREILKFFRQHLNINTAIEERS